MGAVTAVVGVLYALMQDDMKKLLAYSTVENIGVIVIGLGLALVFKASGVPALAALGMTAALLHVLNHSLFKSILFFTAGAILTSTGERKLDQLGGLIHRMPATALFCLIGAAAISALPPLNGFVAEWMLFQAVLNGPLLEQWELKIGFAVIGALLALSAALAAACFVRFYGIVFLGRPRSPAAEKAREVDRVMLAAIGVPAVLCIVIGVLPIIALEIIEPVNRLVAGEGLFDAGGHGGWVWLAPPARSATAKRSHDVPDHHDPDDSGGLHDPPLRVQPGAAVDRLGLRLHRSRSPRAVLRRQLFPAVAAGLRRPSVPYP